MIGDPEILHAPGPRGLGHFGERGPAVAPIGVAMKCPGQVARLDQIGKPARLGGLDFAGVFAQLGRDLTSPSASNSSASVFTRDRTGRPVSAYSLSVSPRARARLRIAILWAFEPVK